MLLLLCFCCCYGKGCCGCWGLCCCFCLDVSIVVIDLVFVVVDVIDINVSPRNLPLKFGQKQVSHSRDIVVVVVVIVLIVDPET